MPDYLRDELYVHAHVSAHCNIAEICGGMAEDARLIPANRCQDSYSAAKAFIVTAVGLLYDERKLAPDELIADILPEYTPADMRWKLATVDMALRHRISLPAGFLDIDCVDMAEFGQDFLAYMFAYPLECAPGERFSYTDGAYYLLGRIVERRAQARLMDLLWERLFGPMGFAEEAWNACPMGHAMGATGLYITAADMAKIDELCLSGGIWRGTRILSEKWVHMAFKRGYELKPVGIVDAYGKGGMYGQMLLVVPETGRVVAWHAYEDGARPDFSEDMVRFCAEYR